MRILHVGEHAGRGGAPSVHSQEVRKALRDRGHSVQSIDLGLKSRFAPIRLLESYRSSLKLSHMLRSQSFDLVYCRETWLDPFRALCLKRWEVPWVVEVNGLLMNDLKLDQARPWLLQLSRWSQGYTLRRATGVFAACAAWRDALRSDYGLERIEVLQNGVDLDAFSVARTHDFRARFGLLPEDLVLGYVGNLGRYYNFEPMLESLPTLVKEFPRLRLLIVGAGPGQAGLQEAVSRAGLQPWVRVCPVVHHSDVASLIQSFDLGWLPVSERRVQETRGVMHAMKLAEYCAAARPIVRVDYPGSDSWAALSSFSWAIQPDGNDTLEVVRKALQSQDQWPAMGQAALEFARQRLSWDATILRLEMFVSQWMS